MSTRCNVIIKDDIDKIIFYRHSDGYPEVTGESLKEFVKIYDNGARLCAMQSAGWLVIQGFQEYKTESYDRKTFKEYESPILIDKNFKVSNYIKEKNDGYDGWKVGAYEITTQIHGDVEYIYTIDLVKKTLIVKDVHTKKSKKLATFCNLELVSE